MKAAKEIFKAYDIRGVVPEQLDAEAAEQVARAFVAYVKPTRVVLGRDVRLTGPEFREAVLRGLTKSGVDVLDIGQVSTDEYYYACLTRDLPGIMITASHNPPEYNGFKMVRKMPEFVLAKEFMPWVLDKTYEDSDQTGQVTEEDLRDEFVAAMLKQIDVAALKPLKVVVDTSNGAQGPVWEKLAAKLPIELIKLNFEPDGTFPNHGNDVIQLENQQQLRDKVKETGADLGLIFDPDGDRCLLVDDRAESIPGDFITALLAVGMLEREPGSTIVYDIRASDAVPDLIKEHGGKPFGWKVGHAYIKPKMQEFDAVFGGEVSGHFYFKSFGFSDCGILTGLTLLEYASKLDGPLSAKVAELEATYHLSGEINSTVADQSAVLARLKERYADAEIDELDGVAIRYPDWHFVVRPSNNEPLIRLTLEAKTRELMEAKRDEVLDLIRQ